MAQHSLRKAPIHSDKPARSRPGITRRVIGFFAGVGAAIVVPYLLAQLPGVRRLESHMEAWNVNGTALFYTEGHHALKAEERLRAARAEHQQPSAAVRRKANRENTVRNNPIRKKPMPMAREKSSL